MVVIDQKVAGAAVATTVTSSLSPSNPGIGQTFTVDDDTGYPATGKFVVVLDRGENNEEKILCNSRSGTTFTVGARGYDGTTASSHTSGSATVEHALAATVIQFMIDHVDDIEVDPHSTKLLNNARHDVEARHQFGSGLAFGVPVTPTALTPDIAGSAGSGNNPAREDHAHNVPAAVAVTSGLVNAEGVAASFARSDHTHLLANLAVTAGKIAPAAIDDFSLFSSDTQPFIVSASDPGVVGANKIWFDVANRQIKIRNVGDAAWDLFGEVVMPWTAYTPALPAGHTEGGTGVVRTGEWTQLGDTVVFHATWNPGSTGNVTAGTSVSVGLPPPTPDPAQRFGVGARVNHAGLGEFAGAGIITAALAGFATNFAYFGGIFDATHPINWGNPGDGAATLDVFGFYKAS